MTNQLERLTQLMASFVNVYKIQNGKLALHKKYFEMDELISGIVSDFQYITKTHTVERHGHSKMTIYADRERIAQVLVNLISNAIKYSPNADKVNVIASQQGKMIIIAVQDFGLGIPKEEQDKIFERFFRVKGKREQDISGLGLGLYISYEIITRHKGKIWLESKEGEGSTFYFSLPIKH
jgi:signal transduction histidine kinase